MRKGLFSWSHYFIGKIYFSNYRWRKRQRSIESTFSCSRRKGRYETSLIHNTIVVRQQTTKRILGVATIFSFQICFSDDTQTYSKSSEKKIRNINLNPAKEINMKPDHLILVLQPFYRQSKSGDYWGRTFWRHIENYSGMISCTSDTAFFWKWLKKS